MGITDHLTCLLRNLCVGQEATVRNGHRTTDLLKLEKKKVCKGYILSPHLFICRVSSVQLLSHVQLLVTPWTAACQPYLSKTNSRSLPKLMSIESVMPCNHLILCRPLLLLLSIFPCIRVFSNESVLRIRWPQFWSFSFSISPSSEYSGLGRVISWHWLSWRMERGRAFMTGQMIGGRMLITLAEIQ